MARKIRILVVDDDPSVLRLLDTALTHFGYAPTSCGTGAEALKLAVPGAFELILLDYRLGSPDGLEVRATLRQGGLRTPVILMSSHFPEEVASRFKDDPGTALLVKPFHLRPLKELIDALLR
jgi:two-component system response regulator MprA